MQLIQTNPTYPHHQKNQWPHWELNDGTNSKHGIGIIKKIMWIHNSISLNNIYVYVCVVEKWIRFKVLNAWCGGITYTFTGIRNFGHRTGCTGNIIPHAEIIKDTSTTIRERDNINMGKLFIYLFLFPDPNHGTVQQTLYNSITIHTHSPNNTHGVCHTVMRISSQTATVIPFWW